MNKEKVIVELKGAFYETKGTTMKQLFKVLSVFLLLTSTLMSFASDLNGELVEAIRDNNTALVQQLLGEEANANHLIDYYRDRNMLMLAVDSAKTESIAIAMAKALVKNGGQVSFKSSHSSESPLSRAVRQNYPNLVKYFINHLDSVMGGIGRNHGSWPLCLAGLRGNDEIARLLYVAGATITRHDRINQQCEYPAGF